DRLRPVHPGDPAGRGRARRPLVLGRGRRPRVRPALGRGAAAVSYYPVFLDLRDLPCVLIGGDALAAAKLRDLLAAGAAVKVIAPQFSPELQAAAAGSHVLLCPRLFEAGDLAGSR